MNDHALTNNTTFVDNGGDMMRGIFAVLIAIACFLILTLALLGNTLVIFVILRFKRLKNPTNYILLSLAITDLAVSFLVMFPSMIQDTLHKWLFSELLCKMYVAFDISCCTASILHLLLVAVDRYIAIFNPLTYKNLVRTWHIVVMSILIWSLSVSMSFLPIFMGWNEFQKKEFDQNLTSTTQHVWPSSTLILMTTKLNQIPSDPTSPDSSSSSSIQPTTTNYVNCAIEANMPYALVSSSLSFWIPLTLMTIVYIQIYIVARRQQNAIAQLDIRSRGFNRHESDAQMLNMIIAQAQAGNNPKGTSSNSNTTTNREDYGFNILNAEEKKKINKILNQNVTNTTTTTTDEIQSVEDLKADKRLKLLKVVKQLKSIEKKRTKDTKAIKTLGIIMGIFILCWLPFFIMYVWVGITQIPFNIIVERLITWIGYINSFINPIIYALTNRDFRKAYNTTLKDLFKKCCTRAYYKTRFGRDDSKNFITAKSRCNRKNDKNSKKNVFYKFFNFFKCKCCCCCKKCSSNHPDKKKDSKETCPMIPPEIIVLDQPLIIPETSDQKQRNGSIIIFNEQIQAFSYIDNDPIKTVSNDKLNSIEPVVEFKVTNLVDENNNKKYSSEISSRPSLSSSSETSHRVNNVKKKGFFKSKRFSLFSNPKPPAPKQSKPSILSIISDDQDEEEKEEESNFSRRQLNKTEKSFKKKIFSIKSRHSKRSKSPIDDDESVLDKLDSNTLNIMSSQVYRV